MPTFCCLALSQNGRIELRGPDELHAHLGCVHFLLLSASHSLRLFLAPPQDSPVLAQPVRAILGGFEARNPVGEMAALCSLLDADFIPAEPGPGQAT